MARDGSGTYTRPVSDYVYDTVISETDVNTEMDDIAAALTASIAKDGQTTPTANLPMGTYRHTGVGNASARTDYAAAGQVQDGTFMWCGTAGGTADALTLTPSPAITAYAAGQTFRFIAGASPNTGAATVQVSGITGPKAIQNNGAALSAGDIAAGRMYQIVYDGTQFQLGKIAVPYTDPMTTRGDVLVRNASNVTARLPVGAADTALVSDGTDPAWAGIVKQGVHTVWIPASAMTARTTNGAADGSTETTTNKVMVVTKDFDASTQEYVQFAIRMPKSWNEGTVTFIPVWSHPSTTTNFGVVWSLAGVAISNDDALDAAFGTTQTSTDTGGTTDDLYQGPESSAITIGGTPAEGDYVIFQVSRVVGDASDTMAVDARLHGVVLLMTVNAGDDS